MPVHIETQKTLPNMRTAHQISLRRCSAPRRSPEQPAVSTRHREQPHARARSASKTRDARVHKTPAQVEGGPAVARRLGGTCEGLVNPDLNGPCVGACLPIRTGGCVPARMPKVFAWTPATTNTSTSPTTRPASRSVSGPAGSVWGAGTLTVEIITFRSGPRDPKREAGGRQPSPEAPARVLREGSSTPRTANRFPAIQF